MSDSKDVHPLQTIRLRATCIYLVLLIGGVPVAAFFDVIALKPLSLNELGDFLAGAFGPLAIFWLVLGFFQQGHELRHSVQALELQAEELRNSVEQQKAMVGITEKQLSLDIEVRDKEKLAAAERDLPFFQLSEVSDDGLRTMGINRTRTYKMTNHGSHAAHVSLNLGGISGSINPDFFQASHKVKQEK